MRINFGNGSELAPDDDLNVQQFVSRMPGEWRQQKTLLDLMLWHVRFSLMHAKDLLTSVWLNHIFKAPSLDLQSFNTYAPLGAFLQAVKLMGGNMGFIPHLFWSRFYLPALLFVFSLCPRFFIHRLPLFPSEDANACEQVASQSSFYWAQWALYGFQCTFSSP